MYLAGYIVTGFLVAGAYAFGRLRGRWGRYERTALAIPLTIAALASPVQVLVGDWAGREVADAPADQARRDRGPARTRRAARPCTCSAGTPTARSSTGSRSPSCSRCSPSTTPTRRVQGLDAVPADDRPPVNVVRVAFQTMVGIGTLLALLGVGLPGRCACGEGACPSRAGSTGRWCSRGPLSLVALIAGWVTTEVGRQPWVVYGVMRTVRGGHRRRRHPGRLRDARRSSTSASASRSCWILRRLARAPLELPVEHIRASGRRLTCTSTTSRWSSSWSGWRSTPCSAAPTSAPASGSSLPAGDRGPSESATTPTTRWRRSGRPTTSG